MGNPSGTIDTLPRIADALGEIAGRLSTLGDELRSLPSTQVSAAEAPAALAATPPPAQTGTAQHTEAGSPSQEAEPDAGTSPQAGASAQAQDDPSPQVGASAQVKATPEEEAQQATQPQGGGSTQGAMPLDGQARGQHGPKASGQQAPGQPGPGQREEPEQQGLGAPETPGQQVPGAQGPVPGQGQHGREASKQQASGQQGQREQQGSGDWGQQGAGGWGQQGQAPGAYGQAPGAYGQAGAYGWQPYGAVPPGPRGVWQPPAPKPSLAEKLARDGAGSKVLAWIGGAVTLLGVVLLLVLAVQRGWVGPVPRVVLGAALGGTLAGLGAWLHRNPAARTGAVALAATGVAVLYADIVAATTLLELIPSWAGMGLGLLVAGGGLALAGYWRAQGFAVFVLLGCAVCAPVLTAGFTALLMTFLLLLAVAAAPVQLTRQWPGVVLAAGLPPIAGGALTVSFASGSWFDTGSDAAVAVLAVLTSLLVLATSTATVAVHREDVTPIALLAVAPLPVMLLPFLLDRLPAAAITGGLTAVLVGLWLVGRKRLPSGVSMVAGVLASMLAFETTAVALTGESRVFVVLAEAIALAAVAIRVKSKGMVAAGAAFGVAGLLAAMGGVASPVMLLRAPRTGPATDVLLSAAAVSPLIALAGVLLAIAAFRTEAAKSVTPLVVIAAGTAVLYGAAGTVLYPAQLLVEGELGFLTGHALITVSWTVAALVLLLRGIRRKAFRLTGLVLVAAALAKLVLFDLASLDGMARVGAFLGAGLVLLAAGARYARLVSATRSAQDSEPTSLRM
ncbi:DUF2339 domain-containing protein [Amycolatopsis magusensis]|uniref:DUF2339 domain-containing protein n=1 Tax=Amycolatopsis magusensis TaxID=882444 RepID=UPI0024A82210|nr:DUF2339 domain-containing protein [Amycolatopsis magusensis]MDI5981296.1 DUF2339 domain-containing protein [Amycolatopsis magusensis]